MQIECQSFHAGDICAIAKLEGVETGDTLSDPKNLVIYDSVTLPTPVIYIAVHPKNKNDEDKISMALNRINLEDPTFEIRRNKETSQLLLGGMGMTHLNYVLERIKNMFKVDDSLDAFWIHGLVGIWGSIATALFIAPYALKEDYNMASQLVSQFQAIGLTIVYSGVVTAIVYFIASAITGGGRVDDESENRGLDETIHGEKALNL